eukprot:SM000023S07555  [mRNA]  locus=s23:139237:144215:+ [translate_table: standard]
MHGHVHGLGRAAREPPGGLAAGRARLAALAASLSEDDIEDPESPLPKLQGSRVLGPLATRGAAAPSYRELLGEPRQAAAGRGPGQAAGLPALQSFAYRPPSQAGGTGASHADGRAEASVSSADGPDGVHSPEDMLPMAKRRRSVIELEESTDEASPLPVMRRSSAALEVQRPPEAEPPTERRRVLWKSKDSVNKEPKDNGVGDIINADSDCSKLESDELARRLQEEEDLALAKAIALEAEENDRNMTEQEYAQLATNFGAASDGRGTGSLVAADSDPVLVALRKCEAIAATLRRQLTAASSSSSGFARDCYAETDTSVAKLVTQADASAACGRPKKRKQVPLKPYQLVGVNFLLMLYRQRVGGAILADEMGLGKTVQAITFLAVLASLEKNPGPHLVVAPASLLENWQRELKMWCPAFSVTLYHGSSRTELREELEQVATETDSAPFNVLLTCYSLFERDSTAQKEDRKFLRRWKFACVLMDEAHLLKDRTSGRTRRVRAIAQRARFRLMLTGTPLQNDLQELWSLLELLMPDIFNSKEYDLNVLLGSRDSAIESDEDDLIPRMKAILGPFVLRRIKADVMKQLAPKLQEVRVLEMEEEQAKAYNKAVEDYRGTVAMRNNGNSGKGGTLDKLPKRQIANIFTHLRKAGTPLMRMQLANHPLLVRQQYSSATLPALAKVLHRVGAFGHGCSDEKVLEEISTYSDFQIHQALAKLLPKLKKQNKRPLIFSQWTSMLDILEWSLDTLGLSFIRLDGSTPVVERQLMVDDFNNSTEVFAFLLSTRAGGQGLNLTGADVVVLHDVDFNPQIDRQAEDRCHRIGQTKAVTVYRLISKDTVDESILKIAQRKLSLDAAVLEPAAEDSKQADASETKAMGEILSDILLKKE